MIRQTSMLSKKPRKMVTKTLHSLQHPFVKYLVSIRMDKDFRRAEKKVLLAGTKMVQEFASSQTPIDTILLQEGCSFSFPARETIIVSYEILKKITGTVRPEPIAALVPLPAFQNLSFSSHLLVLDGIADPGNLGTLLRSALALGWDGVYLLENTCDPFNEKALRAAKGATFRLPLAQGSWNDFMKLVDQNSFQVLVADVEGKDIRQTTSSLPIALLLSRESQGVRDEAKKSFSKITIPIQKQMESLNVATAGAILMYELRKIS